jgi:hypothetical protein
MHSRLFLCLLVFSSATNASGGEGPMSGAEERVTITQFNLQQHVWLTAPATVDSLAPLYVTLPMIGATHESYAPFLERLQEYVTADTTGSTRMPYTLNFDLRGHGKSTRIGPEKLTYHEMRKPHWEEVPPEVAETIGEIVRDTTLRIDSTNITIIGASIGANVGIMVTQLLPGVRRVVMLSPGRNYRGLDPEEAIKNYDGEMLIQVRRRDIPSRKASIYFDSLRDDDITLKIYPERGHGTRVFDYDDEAMQDLLKWLFEEGEARGMEDETERR